MLTKGEFDAPVTTVLRHHPLPGAAADYEEWLKEIIPVAQSFVGHQGVSIIRPHKVDDPYTIILRFDTAGNLRNWLDSDARIRLVQKVRPLLRADEDVDIKTGLEFWFTPSSASRPVKPYKQYLVTLSAIFPLTIVVPWLLQPLFRWAPWLDFLPTRQLLIAALIVGAMVYLIMPRYTRLLTRWLNR